EVWTKAGARPGDVLYLTKPLGTGLLVHGQKEGRTAPDDLARAVAQMQVLNAEAALLLRSARPSAVTDVTGFGLAAHAYELADRSDVAVTIESARLPVLPGAAALAEAGVRTGGDPRNRAYVGDSLEVRGASAAELALTFDPQTAGGLLASVSEPRAAALEEAAKARGVFLARVGLVSEGAGVRLAA